MANSGSNCDSTRHREHAPVLHECPDCLFLTPDPEFKDGTVPCPACGSTGATRRTVPAKHLRRFDERIRNYHREGEHEIVVILAATFLETVFEDMLARMMQAGGAEKRVIELVLDTERSVGLRLGKLFPTLTGEKFEEVATKNGHAEFPRRWREMRSARNAFIHGESFQDPRESLDERMACEAMSLLDEAYDLFLVVNNRFVAKAPAARLRG